MLEAISATYSLCQGRQSAGAVDVAELNLKREGSVYRIVQTALPALHPFLHSMAGSMATYPSSSP